MYVILDQKFQAVRAVTARVGIDGAWVGADRGDSYLFFSTEPGEHHLCTDWMSDFLPTGRLVSLANFTAEPGKVYYFRVRTSGGPSSYLKNSNRSASIDLETLSSRRGRIERIERSANGVVIHAIAPLGELLGYQSHLRSITQGQSCSSIQFVRYEVVPNDGCSGPDEIGVPANKPKGPTQRSGAASAKPDELFG